MDETDKRLVGVVMFMGAIAVIATFQTPVGTVSGIILWIVSLLWIAQARPQTEQTYEAWHKNNTPLEDHYRSNVVRNRRTRDRRAARVPATKRARDEAPELGPPLPQPAEGR